MEAKTFEKLQKRENEIWKYLQAVCDKEAQEVIAELVEINIELEMESNQ